MPNGHRTRKFLTSGSAHGTVEGRFSGEEARHAAKSDRFRAHAADSARPHPPVSARGAAACEARPPEHIGGAHLAQSPVGQASGHSPCSDAEIEGDTAAASFGAAWSRLKDELMHLPPAPDVDSPALEPVGGGLMRLNLRALSALGLRAETVCGLFLRDLPAEGRRGGGARRVACPARRTAAGARRDRRLPRGGLSSGSPASERYRRAYRPAYRLVPEAANAFLSLFQRIDALLSEKPFVRVAIDGNCAAGKSTLGALLREVYGANLFHMDDYFLPFARKTRGAARRAGRKRQLRALPRGGRRAGTGFGDPLAAVRLRRAGARRMADRRVKAADRRRGQLFPSPDAARRLRPEGLSLPSIPSGRALASSRATAQRSTRTVPLRSGFRWKTPTSARWTSAHCATSRSTCK